LGGQDGRLGRQFGQRGVGLVACVGIGQKLEFQGRTVGEGIAVSEREQRQQRKNDDSGGKDVKRKIIDQPTSGRIKLSSTILA
jgi:hypothetical protein